MVNVFPLPVTPYVKSRPAATRQENQLPVMTSKMNHLLIKVKSKKVLTVVNVAVALTVFSTDEVRDKRFSYMFKQLHLRD